MRGGPLFLSRGAAIGTALALLLSFPLSATLVTSSLTGRVTSGEAPAAGVTVEVSMDGAPSLVATTGPNGTYWIESLEPGEYQLTFSRAGLQTLSRGVVVELARVARADASLEPSEDDETVTSTVDEIDVARTLPVTTHFSRAEMERFPVPRLPLEVAAIAPGEPAVVVVDDVRYHGSALLGEEVLEEVTVVRAAIPDGWSEYSGGTIAAVTRSGSGAARFSLRDTLSSDGWVSNDTAGEQRGWRHVVEATAGGDLPAGKIWLFAAGWGGDSIDRELRGLRGVEVKAGAYAGTRHAFTAQYLDADAEAGPGVPRGASLAAFRYSGTHGARTATQASISRTSDAAGDAAGSTREEDAATARFSWFAPGIGGDHLLTATFDTRNERFGSPDHSADTWSASIGDRWSRGRWTGEAGALYRKRDSAGALQADGDGGGTLPRAAVAYDVTGNGRHAISASWGAWDDFRDGASGRTRLAAVGYAAAFRANGLARVDLLRESRDGRASHQLQMEARYRLFDRFDAGATHTFNRDVLPGDARHRASGWLGAEVPFDDQTLGVMLLGHYASMHHGDRAFSTDAAVRFGFPLSGLRVMASVDAAGVLRHGSVEQEPRAVRAWIRLRR